MEEEFKDIIKVYIETDNKIKEIAKDTKTLKDSKKECEDQLLEMMKSQGLNEITLKNGAKIKLVRTKSLEPMNKDFIVNALTEEFQDETKATQLFEKLNEKREVTEKECVKKCK
jgi:CRISPR/Cas system CSM-associated protein Csm3 (group 7 of RAMP superfamily)